MNVGSHLVYDKGWPEPQAHMYDLFWVGTIPWSWSYPVCVNGSGQPYVQYHLSSSDRAQIALHDGILQQETMTKMTSNKSGFIACIVTSFCFSMSLAGSLK